MKPTEETDKKYQKIGKKPDTTNLENFPEYIWPFIHLFNKNKFEKLPEKREWDHKINLLKDMPKELNAKAYTMTVKKDKALN